MKYITLFLFVTLTCSAGAAFADKEKECREQAKSRLELYEKPDSYTINDKEKANALIALFSQCMKEQDGKANDKIEPNYSNENAGKPSNSAIVVGQDGSVRTVNNAGNNYHGASVVIVQAQPSVIPANELYPNTANASSAETDSAKANNANKNAANQQPITIVNNIPPQTQNEQKDKEKEANNKPPASAPVTVNVTNNVPSNAAKSEAEKPQQQLANNNQPQVKPNNTYLDNNVPQPNSAAPSTIINNSATTPQQASGKPAQVSVTVNNSVPNVTNKSEQLISGNNQPQPKLQNLPNANNSYMDGSEKLNLPTNNLPEQLPQTAANTAATTAGAVIPSVVAGSPVVNNSFTPPKPAPVNVTVNSQINNALPASTNNISAPSSHSLNTSNTNKPAPISVSEIATSVPTPELTKPAIAAPANQLPKTATIERSSTATSSSSYREINKTQNREITSNAPPNLTPETSQITKPKAKIKKPHKKIKKPSVKPQSGNSQLEEILLKDN